MLLVLLVCLCRQVPDRPAFIDVDTQHAACIACVSVQGPVLQVPDRGEAVENHSTQASKGRACLCVVSICCQRESSNRWLDVAHGVQLFFAC